MAVEMGFVSFGAQLDVNCTEVVVKLAVDQYTKVRIRYKDTSNPTEHTAHEYLATNIKTSRSNTYTVSDMAPPPPPPRRRPFTRSGRPSTEHDDLNPRNTHNNIEHITINKHNHQRERRQGRTRSFLSLNLSVSQSRPQRA